MIKQEIKEGKESVLAKVPTSMPALLRAQRIGEKAAKTSFDWKDISGVWEKVEEEISELKEEIKLSDKNPTKYNDEQEKAIDHELGDSLFSLCQLARWLNLNAESSLRGSCERFTSRFHHMEKNVGSENMSKMSGAELEQAWEVAKSNN